MHRPVENRLVLQHSDGSSSLLWVSEIDAGFAGRLAEIVESPNHVLTVKFKTFEEIHDLLDVSSVRHVVQRDHASWLSESFGTGVRPGSGSAHPGSVTTTAAAPTVVHVELLLLRSTSTTAATAVRTTVVVASVLLLIVRRPLVVVLLPGRRSSSAAPGHFLMMVVAVLLHRFGDGLDHERSVDGLDAHDVRTHVGVVLDHGDARLLRGSEFAVRFTSGTTELAEHDVYFFRHHGSVGEELGDVSVGDSRRQAVHV